MNSSSPDCPYEVPPFSSEYAKPELSYYWWSWHPCYPYWAKSCWSGKTVEEAWAALAKPFASSMQYYHNKLIREGDGAFTEVYDKPCDKMDVWIGFAKGERRKGDAEPRKDWKP